MAFYGVDPILVADVVLWPARSIIKQSYDARERKNDSNLPHHLVYGNLNGDGFGIGWFPSMAPTRRGLSSDPCVFTSITPAWNNENLNRLATKIESRMVFAHVRAAYPGMPVSEQNCHPFQWGRYLFMHNGVVAGFMQLRRHVLALLRDEAYNAVQSFHSDSAVCFALFLDRLPDMRAAQGAGAILKALEETISLIRQLQREHGVRGNSLLNFCVSDGVNLVATRYASSPDDEPASLYYAEGSAYERSPEPAENASAVASAAAAAADPGGGGGGGGTASAGGAAVEGEGDYHLAYSELGTRVCLVASEPVTASATDWVEVPRNTALIVCPETDGLLCVLRSPLVEGGDHPRRAEVLRCLEAASMRGAAAGAAREAPASPLRPARSPPLAAPAPRLAPSFAPAPAARHRGSGSTTRRWAPPRRGRPRPRGWRARPACPSRARPCPAWPSELTLCTQQLAAGSDDDNASGLTQYGPAPAAPREEDSVGGGPAPSASAASVAPRRGRSAADDAAADEAQLAPALQVPHVLTGHSGSVMALSAEHDLLFSGATDCTIRVWSLISDSCVAVLRGHRDPIRALTVCGPYLASLGAKTLRLWLLSSDFRCAAVLAVADVRGNAKAIAAPCMLPGCQQGGAEGGGGSDEADALAQSEPGATPVSGLHPSPAPLAPISARPPPHRWIFVGSQDCRRARPARRLRADLATRAAPRRLAALHGAPDRISSHVAPAAAAAAATAEADGHAGAVTALALSTTHLFSASADTTVRVWRLPGLQHECTLRGHRGSVLALHVAGGVLLSGGRDLLIRVWDCGTLVCRRTLAGHRADVLALTSVGLAVGEASAEYAEAASPAVPPSAPDTADTASSGRRGADAPASHARQPLLYASASADGSIRIWDAQALACLRVIDLALPVMACALTETHVAAGLPDGLIRLYATDDLFAAAAAKLLGLTGADNGADDAGSLPAAKRARLAADRKPGDASNSTHAATLEREMERALRAFVRIRSISADPLRSEDCFRAAKFLHRLLEGLGAEVKLVRPVEGKSPLVMARLGRCASRPTVTFYGHYDVQPALEPEWRSSPWELTSVDGHLYGRGSSDNKGPVLAFVYAVKELLRAPGSELPVNVAFLIEGEEENGSVGFHEAVSANLDWYEGTELVLISNTLWVGERVPCLTYGMRGMISASIEVTGPERDLHSGNEGGVFSEPLADLSKVLASLVDARPNILVPGFYDDVRPGMLDAAKSGLAAHGGEFSLQGYRAQIGVQALSAGAGEWDLLSARWCQPSLSVVDVRVGEAAAGEWAGRRYYRFGPTRFSVIPRAAVGQVAVRFVPEQRPERLIELLRAHVRHEFAKLRSGNRVDLRVHSVGDWWEADPQAPLTRLAERVVREEWGAQPLLVREGGTMPVARKLERMLGAPVLMLPMGQASDNCHLANERIARVNLFRGKNVVKRLLRELPKAELRHGGGGEGVGQA
ncbi:hypothetical protein QBZ16_003030 [Prototheca wickerhamii]|uniref:Glutamine amidotransferase type-2 domain-containing protein n=1 Tax=Prototheca wickerhamii TaxID=3111 RepID=A0AAD9IIV4_PROWI|nr:hypothetical protein QBZ16_003030 [Prototheca wickerhamii]